MAIQPDTLPRLWVAQVDAPMPTDVSAWLDGSERGRLMRPGQPAVRRARVVAWTLRRWALSRVRPDVRPWEWDFVQGPYGKPELAPRFDSFNLHHNLSHGGAYAAVLIADAPCGVDVEALPNGLEAADVALGALERAAVMDHPCPTERFLQHWALKEAALKLLGTGFPDNPGAFELVVAPDGGSAQEMRRHGEVAWLPPKAQLQGWPLRDGHRLAAALSSPAPLEPQVATWEDVITLGLPVTD